MAGDWIKMRSNLWDDPRVSRICDLIDSGEAPVIGALYWLWATADQHSEDGVMPGLTMRQIDRKTGLPGFAASLVAIGWLADNPEGVVIQKFEEHNGESAKKRCQTAKRVANHRARNDDVTQAALQKKPEPVTQPLAREEKEEEKKSPSLRSGDGRATAPPRPEDVGDVTWSDWLKLRKAKKAPVTATVVAGARTEAAKAGLSLERFLQVWCTRGSQGLQADWLKPEERGSRAPPARSFAESDREAAMARWEQMTNRVHPDRQHRQQRPEFIDLNPVLTHEPSDPSH